MIKILIGIISAIIFLVVVFLIGSRWKRKGDPNKVPDVPEKARYDETQRFIRLPKDDTKIESVIELALKDALGSMVLLTKQDYQALVNNFMSTYVRDKEQYEQLLINPHKVNWRLDIEDRYGTGESGTIILKFDNHPRDPDAILMGVFVAYKKNFDLSAFANNAESNMNAKLEYIDNK